VLSQSSALLPFRSETMGKAEMTGTIWVELRTCSPFRLPGSLSIRSCIGLRHRTRMLAVCVNILLSTEKESTIVQFTYARARCHQKPLAPDLFNQRRARVDRYGTLPSWMSCEAKILSSCVFR